MLFLDEKMRELEVHNVTNFKSEAIADLIKSRGFVDEVITPEHPGFVQTREYYEKLKNEMPKEEYDALMEEVERLMPKKNDEGFKLNEGDKFINEEEKKKFEEYQAKQKKK